MSVSTADTIFLCVSLIGFGGTVIALGMLLHIAYTKMELMLNCLKNCPAVIMLSGLIHGGPLGRLVVLGRIFSVISTPRLFLPDGGACIEDIDKFPKALKRRLSILNKSLYIFTWMFLFCWLIFLVKWTAMPPLHLGVAVLTIIAVPIWALACLWMGKKHGSSIILGFRHSSAITIRARLNATSWTATIIFIVATSIIITCSRFFVSRGTLEPQELKNLPQHLKLKLFGFFISEIILLSCLLGLYLLSE
ncbi:hypothetical protein AYK59_11820 [Pseudomonas synxantha]|uniref:hypothetical protein n=1 Tax=Pseudomonas TaxID=286 RepID=UPI0007512A79|nr:MULTISPECIES: hypothetical protein [Pseudomonas]AMS20795.1 hypothetical protein AYK59_11820 [Pseudomonas synxantha]MDT3228249.1 hypothetical protein [Pseudomonas sp. rhizo25]